MDFGISVSYYPTPAAEIIWTGMGWTLRFAHRCARLCHRYYWVRGPHGAAAGGQCPSSCPVVHWLISYFWLALLGLWLFGFMLDLLPVRHAYGRGVTPGFNVAFIGSVALHALMPALTLSLSPQAGGY